MKIRLNSLHVQKLEKKEIIDESILIARQLQTAISGHATGGNHGRLALDCAGCHTHEGFLEFEPTGMVSNDLDTRSSISEFRLS